MDKTLGKKRRHHMKRIKNRRKNDVVFKMNKESNLNQHCNTPTVCSCHMCGNPRNHSGNSKEALTVQELRVEENTKDQLEELLEEGIGL